MDGKFQGSHFPSMDLSPYCLRSGKYHESQVLCFLAPLDSKLQGESLDKTTSPVQKYEYHIERPNMIRCKLQSTHLALGMIRATHTALPMHPRSNGGTIVHIILCMSKPSKR